MDWKNIIQHFQETVFKSKLSTDVNKVLLGSSKTLLLFPVKIKISIILMLLGTSYLILDSRIIFFLNDQICLCNNLVYKIFLVSSIPIFFIAALLLIKQFRVYKEDKRHHNEFTIIKNDDVVHGFKIDHFNEKEKQVYSLLTNNGGTMFQRDIVIETELPPYTVSRIMNRFMAEGLVDIERYGMTKRITLIKK